MIQYYINLSPASSEDAVDALTLVFLRIVAIHLHPEGAIYFHVPLIDFSLAQIFNLTVRYIQSFKQQYNKHLACQMRAGCSIARSYWDGSRSPAFLYPSYPLLTAIAQTTPTTHS